MDIGALDAQGGKASEGKDQDNNKDKVKIKDKPDAEVTCPY